MVKPNIIKVFFSESLNLEKAEARLVVDQEKIVKLKGKLDEESKELYFEFAEDIELGHSYFVEFPDYGKFPLDVTNATKFDDFDNNSDSDLLYYYSDYLNYFYYPDY